jgi:hypothetical protein
MDSETLRANEWFKAVSGVATNLGSALVAAGFGRWFLLGFDAFVFQWLVAGPIVIWSGLHVLNALEADDAAG